MACHQFAKIGAGPFLWSSCPVLSKWTGRTTMDYGSTVEEVTQRASLGLASEPRSRPRWTSLNSTMGFPISWAPHGSTLEWGSLWKTSAVSNNFIWILLFAVRWAFVVETLTAKTVEMLQDTVSLINWRSTWNIINMVLSCPFPSMISTPVGCSPTHLHSSFV